MSSTSPLLASVSRIPSHGPPNLSCLTFPPAVLPLPLLAHPRPWRRLLRLLLRERVRAFGALPPLLGLGLPRFLCPVLRLRLPRGGRLLGSNNVLPQLEDLALLLEDLLLPLVWQALAHLQRLGDLCRGRRERLQHDLPVAHVDEGHAGDLAQPLPQLWVLRGNDVVVLIPVPHQPQDAFPCSLVLALAAHAHESLGDERRPRHLVPDLAQLCPDAVGHDRVARGLQDLWQLLLDEHLDVERGLEEVAVADDLVGLGEAEGVLEHLHPPPHGLVPLDLHPSRLPAGRSLLLCPVCHAPPRPAAAPCWQAKRASTTPGPRRTSGSLCQPRRRQPSCAARGSQ
mmetsp:Transcript_3583/g.9027  ORF Transcript_3583/g.9027 Transcript_3583/m.9027 type:complete len:341 (-) Transcript_3583:77-1099(-)